MSIITRSVTVYTSGRWSTHQPTRYTNHPSTQTLSTAFQHLPPSSARFSYAAEGVLFISAQLSSNAVSALRKVSSGTDKLRLCRDTTACSVVSLDCGSNLAPKHARKHEAHPPQVKNLFLKEFHLDSNDLGFIWAGVGSMVSYIIWVVCNKLTTAWAPTKNC